MTENLPAVPKSAVPITRTGLVPRDTRELTELAALIADSNLKPEGLKTKADIFLVMAVGMSWGFDPMMALQTLHVVKGKVGMPGETCAALVQSHPQCKDYRVWITGDEGDWSGLCAHVQSWRAGRAEPNGEITFSWADAQQAELTGGLNWKHYPKDMLRWKAVARDKRLNWPDVYPGLRVAEDYDAVEVDAQVIAPHPAEREHYIVPKLPARADAESDFPPLDDSAPTGEREGSEPAEAGVTAPASAASASPEVAGDQAPPPSESLPLPLPEPDPKDPLSDTSMLDAQRKEFAQACRARCVQAKRPDKAVDLIGKILAKHGYKTSKDVPGDVWPKLIMEARQAVVPT